MNESDMELLLYLMTLVVGGTLVVFLARRFPLPLEWRWSPPGRAQVSIIPREEIREEMRIMWKSYGEAVAMARHGDVAEGRGHFTLGLRRAEKLWDTTGEGWAEALVDLYRRLLGRYNVEYGAGEET